MAMRSFQQKGKVRYFMVNSALLLTMYQEVWPSRVIFLGKSLKQPDDLFCSQDPVSLAPHCLLLIRVAGCIANTLYRQYQSSMRGRVHHSMSADGYPMG